MTENLLKKYKKGRISICKAHIDSPRLTYRDVVVPQVVPLYADFDVAKQVGSATLVTGNGTIYALFELSPEAKTTYGKHPPVVLASSHHEKIEEDGVTYLVGATITAASIVKAETYEALYGKEVTK